METINGTKREKNLILNCLKKRYSQLKCELKRNGRIEDQDLREDRASLFAREMDEIQSLVQKLTEEA